LSALLPFETANASAAVSLALMGGFAAPFILASIVFTLLAIYLLANSLHVEVSSDGVRTERRIFGHLVRQRQIARVDVLDVEPRIGARYQNVFSAIPRYMLVARHRGHGSEGGKDVVVAEDLSGQPQMREVRAMICTALNIQINE
jgi:hypothetical protein